MYLTKTSPNESVNDFSASFYLLVQMFIRHSCQRGQVSLLGKAPADLVNDGVLVLRLHGLAGVIPVAALAQFGHQGFQRDFLAARTGRMA